MGVLLDSVAATLLTFVWIWVVALPSFEQSAADPHMPPRGSAALAAARY